MAGRPRRATRSISRSSASTRSMRGCIAIASSVMRTGLAAAFEQPATQPLLHFGDLRRKRGLADAGEFRRAAEMQRLRQRVEIFHLPDGQP